MGHYAKVVEGKVTKVIVADATYFDDFIDDSPGTWVKTSYNTRGGIHIAPNSHTPDNGAPLRKNYAGIGWTYDTNRDAFIPEQPFPSWLLNENTCLWEAPVAKPAQIFDAEGKPDRKYNWNEDTTSWVEITGET
jgi:hypothetical protein